MYHQDKGMRHLEPIIETRRLSHIYPAVPPFATGDLGSGDFTAYRGEYLGNIGQTG